MALWHEIRALGVQLGPAAAAASTALLAPLHRTEAGADVDVARDLAYGPGPRHRVDVFRPRVWSSAPAPVLLFVCGGGFVGGDKSAGPFFANIGIWAARHGIIAVNMNYRLAPEHPWPAGAEDVARAVSWIGAAGAAAVGPSSGICLMGHSAGAAHAAAYISHPGLHGPAGPGVAAAMLVSGLYDIVAQREMRAVPPYYGSDPALYGARSAIPQIKAVRTPVAVAVSELDPPPLQHEALRMIAALTERDDIVPPIVRLGGHNHFTGVFSINLEAGRALEYGVLELVERYCRRGGAAVSST
jgi:acetyl esterase/lipase